MFKQIKERIEDIINSIQEEVHLKKRLKTYETTRWRLENMRFPESEYLEAFGIKEWRN